MEGCEQRVMPRCLTVAVVRGRMGGHWSVSSYLGKYSSGSPLAGPNFEPRLATASACCVWMCTYYDRKTAHLLFDIKVGKWRRRRRLQQSLCPPSSYLPLPPPLSLSLSLSSSPSGLRVRLDPVRAPRGRYQSIPPGVAAAALPLYIEARRGEMEGAIRPMGGQDGET